jgi:DNA-binding CsgD family transcriptional regulator
MRLVEAAMFGPDLSGMVVCGAAGVGKSRIVREALESAAAKGCETRWAVASSSARSLPLGAFAPWASPSDGSDLQLVQLVRGVIESLTSAAPGMTAVVSVDDVHLLDDLSAFVLHQIVQRRAAKVVLTLRAGEPVPAAVAEVWRDTQFGRLDLQPLSSGETTALVSATLGGPLEPDAARRLWQLTRGNVLYLRNIVEREVADGRLAQRNGTWWWTGSPVVPPDLVEMVEARIGALPAAVADVIDALAVGEPIALPSLARITDPAAIEEADNRGLITIDEVDGRVEVRIAHPLYGEVRRKRAPAMRLRRLRGLVAAELAASSERDDMQIVVRRATLSLESDLEPDADMLVRAAQGATGLADLSLADRLANAAIRAGAGAEATFVRAHVLGWLNRGHEADAMLAECSTDELSDTDHARLAFLRANNRLWALADPEGAKRLIDQAAQTIPPASRSCIDAFLVVYWSTAAKPEAAIEHSRNFVLDELPDVVCGETASAMVGAFGANGRVTDALSAADSGFARAARSFDAPYMRSIITEMLVGALVLSGQIGDACEVADQLRRQGADLPGHARSLSSAVAGRAALGAGRLDTACALLEPVVELFFASGNTEDIWYHCQPRLTTALAMRGRSDDAAAALARLLKRQHPTRRFLDVERAVARAWVAACQGAVSEAIAIMSSTADAARASGWFGAEVMCLQTATQFGDRTCGPRLRELATVVEGPRAGMAARFAAASRGGDGAELLAVSEGFEHMGDLIGALDAAALAAAAYRRDEHRGSALTCSARADELALRCGGASTPALLEASERLPLSSREREIAMLIGQGLSSKAIAERLTVSARTVEGHIYRAMMKTGATDRDQLAAMLPRHGQSP